MQVSRKQLSSAFGRIIAARTFASAPRHTNSAQITSLLHNSLRINLPPGKPIILPGDIGLAYNDLLATLRTEIDSKNPAGVWNAFSRLQNAGHADHLGVSDLEEVDTTIAPTVFVLVSKRLSEPLRPLSQKEQKSSLPSSDLVAPITQVHELGLWLAVRGQICTLRASMVRALRESKPNVVLDLWQAYVKRCLAGEGDQVLETVARSEISSGSSLPKPRGSQPRFDPPDLITPPPQPEVLKYANGRPELLAHTICAHAMLDDFRGAFDTAYLTTIPIKPETFRDLLEPIREVREDVVAEVLRYAIDLNLLRMLARPWTFRNYLLKFTETFDLDQVQTVYAKIIGLLREPEPWIGPLDTSATAPIISDPKQKPIFSVSRQTWCDLIEASDTLRQPKLKQRIWEDIQSLGVSPTTGMWNTLMLGYVRAGDMERARRIWDTMGKDGRDVYSYAAMIQGLFERHQPEASDAARKYFEEMRSTIPKEHIGIRSYNIFIHGLISNGYLDAALNLVSELEANAASPTPAGPVPDITTYNTILRRYSRRRDLASLSKVLRTIADSNLTPDNYTFATILDALLGLGAKDAPTRILEIMKALKVEPNAAIVAELIEHIVYPVAGRGGRPRDKSGQQKSRFSRVMPRETSLQGPSARERLQLGVKMLVEFEDAGVETNVVNYTSLMTAFHRAAGAGLDSSSHYVSYTEAQQAAQMLRERMKKRNIHENRATYNILIAACLEGGAVPQSEWRALSGGEARTPVDMKSVPPNVVQAVRYFHEMRGARLLPNHDTWYILLSGVASHGQIALARALCDELVETRFLPQTGLLKLVMKIKGFNE